MQEQPRPSEQGYLQIGNGKQSKTERAQLLPAFPCHYVNFKTCEPPDAKKIESLARGTEKAQTTNLTLEESKELCQYRALWKSDTKWIAEPKLDKDRPVTVMQDFGLCKLELQCLDTPGLDDSFGRDNDHMESILTAMAAPDVDSVIAFVFIAKNGQPFGDHFLRAVQRYWDQFPTFRHNWIFLHTAVDPSKTDHEDGSCYEQDVMDRRRLLIEGLQRTCRDEDEILPNLPHVFVENAIPDDARVSTDPSLKFGLELKKAARAEAHNALLLSIASNKPVPVKDLKYAKSEGMKSIDRSLAGQFRAYKVGVLQTLRTLENQHSQLMGRYTKSVERMATVDAKIQDIERQIEEIDTDKLVVYTQRTVERPWRVFGNSENISIPSKILISHKDIVCDSEFAYTQVEDKGVEDVGNGTYVWRVRMSSPAFRSSKAICKIYVEQRRKQASTIKRLRKEKDTLSAEKNSEQKQQAGMEGDLTSVEQQVKILRKVIEDVTREETTLLASEIDMATYSKMKSFYNSADFGERLMNLYCEARGVSKEHLAVMSVP